MFVWRGLIHGLICRVRAVIFSMKLLTTNFVQCAVKSCARSTDAFPLKYEECELVRQDLEFDPQFVLNVMGKLDWPALLSVAADLGNTDLPPTKPEADESNEQLLRDLHALLLETQIKDGKMTCKNCGNLYHIKNTIPNFLLPPHLA